MAHKTDYFSNEALQQDLKGKTVRGGVWTAVAQGGVTLIQLMTIPFLTRLLTKEDFGLVELAMVFTGFAAMFVDAGMSMATIQRPEITHRQVSNLFWLSSLLGGLMALASAAAAPGVAWFFGKPELTPLVIALGSAFLFSGLTTQHQALLMRAMRYREVAIIRVGSALCAGVVSVWLAWQYRSYWALAAGQVALAVFGLVLTWVITGWQPGLPKRGSGVRQMASFGADLTVASMLRWLTTRGDNLLIGKVWGEGELGVYSLAYRIFLMPITRIMAPLSAVAVPALSRLHDSPERYRRYYEKMAGLVTMISLPLAAFLFGSAENLIPAVFGEGWDAAVPILRALSVVGCLGAFGNTMGWLYVSQGRSREQLVNVMVTTPVVLLGICAGLPWGAFGVAVGLACSVVCFRFPFALYRVTRKGPVGVGVIMRVIGRAAPVAAAALAGAVAQRFLPLGGDEVVRFGASLALAVLFTGAVMLVSKPWVFLKSSA